ncbi:hypothetical protein [Streptomyces sp. NPDC093109]|uniref:hypothetical protein n=1 Tax=Streptomyces sp. NPDC093109 TaxID=3154977 RepID=UPI00344D7895
MSALQPRNDNSLAPTGGFRETLGYRAEYVRVWCADVLPVLVEYRARQLGRDLRAEWRAAVAEMEWRIGTWLDRNGW